MSSLVCGNISILLNRIHDSIKNKNVPFSFLIHSVWWGWSRSCSWEPVHVTYGWKPVVLSVVLVICWVSSSCKSISLLASVWMGCISSVCSNDRESSDDGGVSSVSVTMNSGKGSSKYESSASLNCWSVRTRSAGDCRLLLLFQVNGCCNVIVDCDIVTGRDAEEAGGRRCTRGR